MSSSKGVVLVTGSAQGIGRAIALKLAEDGFNVAINDIMSKKDIMGDVVNEIKLKGRRSIAVVADVSNDDQVKEMVAVVVRDLGGLDVMVANAGIAHWGSLLDTGVDEWDRVMAINARGIFLCYKYAAEQMIKQGRPGRIIGASSIAGKKGNAMFGPYTASKFAVRGLTQAAACELGKHGITVNAYAPGPTNTAMVQITNDQISKATGAPSDIMALMKDLSALGKCGNPEDIASLVSYLASAESHFITGQTITVDGGIFFD